MASAVTIVEIFAKMALKLFDHDPGTTAATVVSGDGGTTKNYLDMRDYENFAVVAMNSVSASSSGPTLVEILAATDTSGTNAQVIVASSTVASVTVGDNVTVECNAAQIKEIAASSGFALRYVTARITCTNAGDECVVLMARFNSKFPASGLTANNIT